MVGEHSYCIEAAHARGGGAIGRENVGMSNEKIGEIPVHRKSKGSWERFIHSGLVDNLSRGQLE